MAVVPFSRPPDAGKTRPQKPAVRRRSFGEFALAMLVMGIIFFLLPTLWSGVPRGLLAAIHLLVAAVYFQQGPRIAAAIWIGLTLVVLALFGQPSPVGFALDFVMLQGLGALLR